MKLKGGTTFRIPTILILMCLSIGVMTYSFSTFAASGTSSNKTDAKAHAAPSEDGHAESHSEGGGDHGGDHHGQEWKTSDTARILNFVLLVLIIGILLKKPIKNGLKDRTEGIKENLKDLEAKKIEAEQKLKEYNEKLSSLESEAKQLIDEYVRQGEEAKAKIVGHAKEVAQKLEEQAKKNIDYEFNQAKIKLQTEVMEKAILKAESLIRDNLSEDDQDRLIDEYLDKVEA